MNSVRELHSTCRSREAMYYTTVLLAAVMTGVRALHYQSCDDYCISLQFNQRASIHRPECVCSFGKKNIIKSEINNGYTIKPITDDSSIFYEPAETHTYSFSKKPFHVINPIFKRKYHNNVGDRKHEAAKHHVVNKLTRSVSNTIHKEPKNIIHKTDTKADEVPVYLDIDIQKSYNNERFSGKTGLNDLTSTEDSFVECVDLHILIFLRNNNVDNHNLDIWDVEKHKKYENFTNSELLIEIKNKCEHSANIVKESLQEITSARPRKYLTKLTQDIQNEKSITNGTVGHNKVILITTIHSHLDEENLYTSPINAEHAKTVSENNDGLESDDDTTTMSLLLANNDNSGIPTTPVSNFLVSNNEQSSVKDLSTSPPMVTLKNGNLMLEENSYESTTADNMQLYTGESIIESRNLKPNDPIINDESIEESDVLIQPINETNTKSTTLNELEIIGNESDIELYSTLPTQLHSPTTFINIASTESTNGVTYSANMILVNENNVTKDTNLTDDEHSTKHKNNTININKIMGQILQTSTTVSTNTLGTSANFNNTDFDMHNDFLMLTSTFSSYPTASAISSTENPRAEDSYTSFKELSMSTDNGHFKTESLIKSEPTTVRNSDHITVLLNGGKARDAYPENEIIYAKIVTKEFNNDSVISVVNGTEAIPIEDFQDDSIYAETLVRSTAAIDASEEKESSSHKLGNIQKSNGTQEYMHVLSEPIVGKLYFLFGENQIPVRFVQDSNGEIGLGVDGISFCDKLKQTTNDSVIIAALCKCSHTDDSKKLE